MSTMRNKFELDRVTSDFAAAVVKNIPSMPGNVMKAYLEDEATLKVKLATLRPHFSRLLWEKILLQAYPNNAVELVKKLEEDGVIVDMECKEIICRSTFKIVPKDLYIDLVHVTGYDLDMKKDEEIPYEEFLKRAQDAGVDLCPIDTGPQFWLRFRDWNGHFRHVKFGAPPILNDKGKPCVFYIETTFIKRFLDVGSVGSVSADRDWLFVRREKSKPVAPEEREKMGILGVARKLFRV